MIFYRQYEKPAHQIFSSQKTGKTFGGRNRYFK
jgi:hypothetical protein